MAKDTMNPRILVEANTDLPHDVRLCRQETDGAGSGGGVQRRLRREDRASVDRAQRSLRPRLGNRG